MALMTLKNVNKYYLSGSDLRFHALKNINLSFNKGELVSIIGESGSGKSTLMNLIGGLDRDFEGEILVDGVNIGTYNENQRVMYNKEKIGFVFQSFNLIPHLNVLENVALAMTLSNVSKKIRVERAKKILAEVGLEKQYYKKPNQLSGGQKQRVAIARSLVNDPEIIIADEPTGALDSETADQVLQIFSEIAASGKLVLLVTHSERVAARSSRIVTIADGSIISDQEYPENQVYHSKEHLSRFSLTSRPKNRNLSFFAAMKLAFLNMKEKFSRSVLIALGGSIGIMSIILMLSLGSGVNAYLTNLMQEQVNPVVSEVRMPEPEEQETSNSSTSEITGDPTGMPMDPAQNSPVMRNDNVPFEQSDLEILENIDGVASLEKGYSTFSLGNNSIMYNDRYRSFMNFITMSSMITTANLSEGEFPQEGEILITQGIANSIGEDSIGKEVTVTLMMDGVITETDMVISGIFASSDAVGPTAVFDSIYMNYADVEAIAQANDIELLPNVVYLVAEDAQANTRVKEEIKTLGYQGSAMESIAKLFTDMIDIFTYILAGVAGLSLFVSAIMILTVLYISVVERTQEIGVIKATGGRKKDIRRIFVSESFLIGVFSGSFGVGFAYILSIIGNRVVEQQFGTTIFLVEYQFIVMGMVISILLSVIAGLLPSVRASRLDPVEALRHE